MKDGSINTPYHYGDLQQSLQARRVQQPAAPEEKTTGMIAVPVVCFLICLSCAAFVIGAGLHSGRHAPWILIITEAVLLVAASVLPVISIRNFIKGRRAKCR